MGKLQVLPAQIANMIAAGEVVQRPASVVKELMENAIDAGATQVSVIIADSGRTMIQVIDNGCGMSPADAILCFERHATSKIATPEDLGNISTFGFRGEALASIAAVAEITLKTRRKQDETATQVTITDFGSLKTSSTAAPEGTNFTIRNIFYNTPARRKFLKSDTVELKHIIEEFTRVAITRPETGFTLRSNNRDIFILKPAKSLKFRILDLMGANVVGDIVDVECHSTTLEVKGFIGRPDGAKKTSGNQYFFVNGRFFRSPYLHKAVMKAYEEMIPDGYIPSYFLFLTIDPHSIDVNIHPTKTEIKFEEDSLVFQILYACVKETLGRNCFGASIDFDTEGAVELPQLGSSFEQYRGMQTPTATTTPGYNPFDYSDAAERFERELHESGAAGSSGEKGDLHIPGPRVDARPLFANAAPESPRTIVIQGRYIVTTVASGVMWVNIKRAWERILYDRALEALTRNGRVCQKALFPIRVQVGAQQLPVFAGNDDMLQALGFDIKPDGVDSVLVAGMPEGFSCEAGKVEQTVNDLLYILSEGKDNLQDVVLQQTAQQFAALGTAGASEIMSASAAGSLIDTLFASSNAEFTPGGKRIVRVESINEIEKKF